MLSLLELSYMYIIKQIRKKFTTLKIIINGYDYFVPSFQRGPGFLKYIFNKLMDNGKFLKEPMKVQGISDPLDQRAIIFAMVHLLNEMIINLVDDPVFGSNVYLIDCRGNAQERDWFDEIHLAGPSVVRIAETYMEAILNQDPNKKVFKVKS